MAEYGVLAVEMEAARSTPWPRSTAAGRWRSARSRTTSSPARRPPPRSGRRPSATWSRSPSPRWWAERPGGQPSNRSSSARSGRSPGVYELAVAHVVERRADLLQRQATQLRPGQPVDRELERVGGVLRGWSSSRRRGACRRPRANTASMRPRTTWPAEHQRERAARPRAAAGRRRVRPRSGPMSSARSASSSIPESARPGRSSGSQQRRSWPNRLSTHAWNRVPNRAAATAGAASAGPAPGERVGVARAAAPARWPRGWTAAAPRARRGGPPAPRAAAGRAPRPTATTRSRSRTSSSRSS